MVFLVKTIDDRINCLFLSHLLLRQLFFSIFVMMEVSEPLCRKPQTDTCQTINSRMLSLSLLFTVYPILSSLFHYLSLPFHSLISISLSVSQSLSSLFHYLCLSIILCFCVSLSISLTFILCLSLASSTLSFKIYISLSLSCFVLCLSFSFSFFLSPLFLCVSRSISFLSPSLSTFHSLSPYLLLFVSLSLSASRSPSSD